MLLQCTVHDLQVRDRVSRAVPLHWLLCPGRPDFHAPDRSHATVSPYQYSNVLN